MVVVAWVEGREMEGWKNGWMRPLHTEPSALGRRVGDLLWHLDLASSKRDWIGRGDGSGSHGDDAR